MKRGDCAILQGAEFPSTDPDLAIQRLGWDLNGADDRSFFLQLE